MKNYEYRDLFFDTSTDKQLLITYDTDKSITSSNLHSGTFEISQMIQTDDRLTFGTCCASALKMTVTGVDSIQGKWLDVAIIPNHHTDKPLKSGKFKVFSDNLTIDRRKREIVAYDRMYDVIQADVTSWYNGLKFPMTLKAFRDSFCAYLGITQQTVSLANDTMIVEKTIEPSSISGADVLSAITELNGVFGHFVDDTLNYVSLGQIQAHKYTSSECVPPVNYGNYQTPSIDALTIRQDNGAVGVTVGTGTNIYYVSDNFLTYGKSTADMQTIANNLFGKIKGSSYRTIQATVVGNPCIELGDMIAFADSDGNEYTTYVLNRTINNVQAMKDTFTSQGKETMTEDINSSDMKFSRQKQRTNILERDIEQTKSAITRIDSTIENDLATKDELSTTITQTAEGFNEEIKKINQTTLDLQNQIDGAITTFFYEGVPNLTNFPTSEWKTNDEKNKHIGDLYYDKTTGDCYRFMLDGSTYKWVQIADEDISKALQAAKDAQDTADGAVANFSNYSTTTEMNSAIKKSADSITSEVAKTYATQLSLTNLSNDVAKTYVAQNTYSTKMQQVDTSIGLMATAESVQTIKGDLEQEISKSATATLELGTKTTKDNVISYINASAETVTINASKINLNGAVTADSFSGTAIQSKNYAYNTSGTKINLNDGTIDTKNFKVDSTGKVTMSSAEVNGSVISKSGNNYAKIIGGYVYVGVGDTDYGRLDYGTYGNKKGIALVNRINGGGYAGVGHTKSGGTIIDYWCDSTGENAKHYIYGDTEISGNVTLGTGTVTAGGLLPKSSETYNIGASTAKWNNVYANNFVGVAKHAGALYNLFIGSAFYANNDTHIMQLGYFNCTDTYDNCTILVSSAFWGNQHNSIDIISVAQDTNTGTILHTIKRLRVGGNNLRTFYYLIDNNNKRLYLFVKVTGGNSYGRWRIATLSSSNMIFTLAEFKNHPLSDSMKIVPNQISVIDSHDNTNEISITYSKAGQSSTSWLASWNGYELGAISPSNVKCGSASYADSANDITSKEPQLAAANESNIIKVYNNNNGTLGTNYRALRNAIGFNWYGTRFEIGNLRGDSTNSAGFGIAYREGTTYKEVFSVSKDGAIGTATIPWGQVSEKPSSYNPSSGSLNYVQVFNSANLGGKDNVSVNDIALKHNANGMVNSATDNPLGAKKWVHVWSQSWSNNNNTNWVSQIALGTEAATGMYYRTNTGGSIVGKAWTRVADSANFTTFALSKSQVTTALGYTPLQSHQSLGVHVTAEGTSSQNGAWKYRKWSNGRLELWGEVNANIAITSGYAGHYYYSGTLALPTDLGINAVSYVQTGVTAATGLVTLQIVTRSTSSIKYYLHSPSSLGAQNIKADFYVLGTFA